MSWPGREADGGTTARGTRSSKHTSCGLCEPPTRSMMVCGDARTHNEAGLVSRSTDRETTRDGKEPERREKRLITTCGYRVLQGDTNWREAHRLQAGRRVNGGNCDRSLVDKDGSVGSMRKRVSIIH